MDNRSCGYWRRKKNKQKMNEERLTYEIVTSEDGKYTGIKCLDCGRTSYHPVDIKEKYCGFCHEFHSTKQREREVWYIVMSHKIIFTTWGTLFRRLFVSHISIRRYPHTLDFNKTSDEKSILFSFKLWISLTTFCDIQLINHPQHQAKNKSKQTRKYSSDKITFCHWIFSPRRFVLRLG